jgi:hypothetical protein
MRILQLPRHHALVGAVLLAFASQAFAQTPQTLIFNGGSDDRGNAIVTDAAGNILVGGSSSSSTASSFVVVKYDAAGSFLWQSRAAAIGEYKPGAVNALAVDAAGNTYAAGHAAKPLPFLQTEWGWLVASFDAAGNQRWSQLFNGAGNSFDVPARIVLHPQQGLYVTGVTAGAFGRADWLTIKYSLDGVEQWRRIEAGIGNTDDRPVDLETDEAGNVVVLGYVQPVDVSGPKDIRVIKYDSQGNVTWRTDYSDTAASDESPSRLAIDDFGNIYVVADRPVSTNPELLTEPITVKFDANGNRLFVLAGPGQGGSALALDAAGSFVVSGIYFEEGGSNLIRQTSKFTHTGAMVWTLPGTVGDLAVDPVDGSAYIVDENAQAVLKVSATGQILWQQALAAGQRVNAVTLDDTTGAFIHAGNINSGFGDIITVRYGAGGPPTPPVPVPAAASGLTLSARKGSLTLNWTDNADNETGFLMERSVNGGGFVQIAQVGANVRTFTNSGLSKNTSYTYRVRAFNANGNSAFSNTATGSPR